MLRLILPHEPKHSFFNVGKFGKLSAHSNLRQESENKCFTSKIILTALQSKTVLPVSPLDYLFFLIDGVNV